MITSLTIFGFLLFFPWLWSSFGFLIVFSWLFCFCDDIHFFGWYILLKLPLCSVQYDIQYHQCLLFCLDRLYKLYWNRLFPLLWCLLLSVTICCYISIFFVSKFWLFVCFACCVPLFFVALCKLPMFVFLVLVLIITLVWSSSKYYFGVEFDWLKRPQLSLMHKD